MGRKGILIIISGFSGAGKGTLVKRLLEKYSGQYALSISATTRKPREGEKDGREYFFITTEEFEKMIAKGELIEYARYVENYYGTPRYYVEQMLSCGKDVILEIEMQGALKVRKTFPDAILLFVTPPSVQELEKRLSGRGTESAEVIASRMRRAVEETQYMRQYDYIVENDRLEACVEEIHTIVQAEHNRSFRNMELIHKIEAELKGLKGEETSCYIHPTQI